MIPRLLNKTADGGVLVLDGGTGSELGRRGVRLDPDAWSAPATLTDFETLVGIHADFIDAGADIVTTNTFAASRFVLAAAGLEARATELVRRAVEAARLARERCGRDVAIAGSMSCLPPAFDTHRYPDERAERSAYAELAETLAAAGVDALLLEMMQETRHAPLACEAAHAVGLPVWLGVSCRRDPGGTLVGFDSPSVPLATCLETLLPWAPAAVAVMHSPLDALVPALAAVRQRWAGLLGAYPEIGDAASGTAAVTPEDLVREARAWLEAGARLLGGCCATTPAHVRALAARYGNGIGATCLGTS
jgi:S-methylmethionine-dependent homocysteine/selenocysteine methylase